MRITLVTIGQQSFDINTRKYCTKKIKLINKILKYDLYYSLLPLNLIVVGVFKHTMSMPRYFVRKKLTKLL